jgi:hypothetical protein
MNLEYVQATVRDYALIGCDKSEIQTSIYAACVGPSFRLWNRCGELLSQSQSSDY